MRARLLGIGLSTLACACACAFAPRTAAAQEKPQRRQTPQTQPEEARGEGPFVIDNAPTPSPLPVPMPTPEQQPYGLPSGPDEPRRDGLVGAGTVELAGVAEHVDVGRAKDTYGGGALAGRLMLLGFTKSLVYRVQVRGALGGGSQGLVTRFTGDASLGPAFALGKATRLFARAGLEAHGHKDDVLDASVYTLPGASAGIQWHGRTVMFELAPRAGLGLRSQFDPGSEAEGTRLHRRARVRPTWGGTAALLSPYLLFEASATRVEETAGMWLGEASACALFGGSDRSSQGLVLCGSGELWNGKGVDLAGQTRHATAVSAGLSVGIGFLDLKIMD